MASRAEPGQVADKGTAAWLYALPDTEGATGTAAPGPEPGQWTLSYDGETDSDRVFADPVLSDSGRLVDVSRNGVPLSRTVKPGPGTTLSGSREGKGLSASIISFTNFGAGLWVKIRVRNDSPRPGEFVIDRFVTGGKGFGASGPPGGRVYPETTVVYSLFVEGAPATPGKLYTTLVAGVDGGGGIASAEAVYQVPALA